MPRRPVTPRMFLGTIAIIGLVAAGLGGGLRKPEPPAGLSPEQRALVDRLMRAAYVGTGLSLAVALTSV